MKKILLLGLSASLFMAPLCAVVPKQSLFSNVLVHKAVSVDAEKLAAAELVISPNQKWSFSRKIIDLHNKGKLIQWNIIPLLESKNIPVSGGKFIATSLMISAVTTASNMKKRICGKGFAAIMEGESNLTAENVKELIDAYRTSGNNPDAPYDKEMIIELLKERKNILVKEMNDEMWKQMNRPSLGDIMTEDYAIFATIGLAFLFGSPYLVSRMGTPNDLYGIGFYQGIGLSMAVMAIQKLREYRHEIRSREEEMNYLDEVIEKLKSLDIA